MSDRIRNLSSYCAASSPTSGNILNKPSHPTSFQNTYICDCWEEMFEPKRCLARLSPDLHPAAPSFVSSSRPQLHIIPTLTFACSESPLLDHKCGLSTYQRRYYETGVEKWKRSPGASRGTICLAASSLLQGVAVAQLMEGSSYPGPGQFEINCYRSDF